MEGLEISELMLNEVFSDNKSLRIDSNYFEKEAICIDEKLKMKPHFFIDKKNIVSGPFGSTLKSDAYLNTGVPFVRIESM